MAAPACCFRLLCLPRSLPGALTTQRRESRLEEEEEESGCVCVPPVPSGEVDRTAGAWGPWAWLEGRRTPHLLCSLTSDKLFSRKSPNIKQRHAAPNCLSRSQTFTGAPALGFTRDGAPRRLWKSQSRWALHSLQWRTLKSSRGAGAGRNAQVPLPFCQGTP